MSDSEWSDDVFKEKSLYDVYKASKVIEPSEFNIGCMKLSFVLCALYVAFNLYTGVKNDEVISAIGRISSSMITMVTAVLGFLIAGFSIFTSLTPKETLRDLIKTRYKKTDISYFKQIMFNFLNVFTVYLVLLSVLIAINAACPLGWSPLIEFHVPDWVVSAFNSVVLSGIALGSIYAVLRLKSFIWTMYQGLLVNVML
jgi:hypothetical protein